MATRSNMVLMDLFTACEEKRGVREMVCRYMCVGDVLSLSLSLSLGLSHMRPTLCNYIMILSLCARDDTCHDVTMAH